MGSLAVTYEDSMPFHHSDTARSDVPTSFEADLIPDGFEGSESGLTTVSVHPLGVKPLGNAYMAHGNIRTNAGLLAILPDELITQIMESSQLKQFQWHGSWLSTYLGVRKERLSQIQCDNLFSDALHRPFLCTHSPLLPHVLNIPEANTITRLGDLTSAEFAAHWADRPFILTDPARQWPAFHQWSLSFLREHYGDVVFRAEAVDWPYSTYSDYMSNNQDESPLYLFDHSFVEKMGLKVGDVGKGHYWPPACFGEDLFDVFGDQRPDRRWLIVGDARSGSSFHKDPNATSAWNAVLRGSKYWIMFPSDLSYPAPPGVYVSEDQSEVTSPLSIAEWLLSFHTEARRTRGCKEGICREGEVLHVPSGWWHLVVNLSPSIAITQNFVPRTHLVNALAFLKDKPDQVSGFKADVKDPYHLFTTRLNGKHPRYLQESLAEMSKLQMGRKRKWEELVQATEAKGPEGNEFSFGFGDGDDENVP
ncbi:MAG: hypothetical protein Q9174_004083 [Haloplaca sp. 1 TL-2023]